MNGERSPCLLVVVMCASTSDDLILTWAGDWRRQERRRHSSGATRPKVGAPISGSRVAARHNAIEQFLLLKGFYVLITATDQGPVPAPFGSIRVAIYMQEHC